MTPERLASLPTQGIAFDLETWLIQPGNAAPPIVCGSYAMGSASGILTRTEAAELFKRILEDDSKVLIGANIAFDVICMLAHFARQGIDISSQVIAMYTAGRVYDVQIAEALHAVATGYLGRVPTTGRAMIGRYSLAACTQQVLGRDNAKENDQFRLSYALLDTVPISEWPAVARQYPIDDAVNTLHIAHAQAGHTTNVGPHLWVTINRYPWLGCAHCRQDQTAAATYQCASTYVRSNIHELARQTFTHFCMQLGAAWGFHVDHDAVNALEAKYDAEHAGKLQPFMAAGILRPDGTENQTVLKQLVARAYGAKDQCSECEGTGKVPSPKTEGRTKVNCTPCGGTGLELPAEVPRTDKDGIGKGRDPLYESGDEFLIAYANDVKEGQKISKTYIPWLRQKQKDGTQHIGVPLLLRPNVILETGRTSYDGCVQLLPRMGGIRECIQAREGYVFSSEDYRAGELVTHAQSCIWLTGSSRLADALNTGLDAHLAGAATIVGINYAEALKRSEAGDKQIKNIRQAFKPCNFGFPGRMGAAKLVQQQRKGGPDTKAPDGTRYKGLRFCILMGVAERCGVVKVSEWKGNPYPPTCKACLECAEDLRKSWLLQWPENIAYFAIVKQLADGVERGNPIVQHVTKRLRGFRPGQVDDDGNPTNYGNAIANGFFQALLADAAKDALVAVTKRCFAPGDPLYGSRVILFAHDELVAEHPAHVAHEGAHAISFEMEASLKAYCPDLAAAVEAKPTLMRRFYKGAEPVYKEGRLIPWEPKPTAT